jgi:hypothetical protein
MAVLSGLKHEKTKSIQVIPQTAKLKKEAAVSNPTAALCYSLPIDDIVFFHKHNYVH